MSTKTESAARLAFIWLIVFPATCTFFSTIFAGPIAAAEGIPYKTAFIFSMQALTLCDAVPLTAWAPAGTGGQVLTLFLGIFLQMIFVVHVGISAGPCMDPFLEEMRRDDNLLVSRSPSALAKKFGIFFFGVFPAISITFAAVFGGLLAAAEGWPFVDGFVMVLGEVTLTGVKNPDTPPPSGDGGQVVAVFIAVVAQGILGIVIALGSVPLLGFDLAFDDSPLRQVAIWVFNSEQKEQLFKDEDRKTSPADLPPLPPHHLPLVATMPDAPSNTLPPPQVPYSFAAASGGAWPGSGGAGGGGGVYMSALPPMPAPYQAHMQGNMMFGSA